MLKINVATEVKLKKEKDKLQKINIELEKKLAAPQMEKYALKEVSIVLFSLPAY
jgi:hypothetical protein